MSETKSAFLVCEGAQCQCDKGLMPAGVLKVVNSNHVINTVMGSKLATDKETSSASLTFMTCKIDEQKQVPCAAQLKWKDVYEDMEADGAKVLLDISTATCSGPGKGKITIKHHGQSATVKQNLSAATMAVCVGLTPALLLAPYQEVSKPKAIKPPKVSRIRAMYNKNEYKSDAKPNEFKVFMSKNSVNFEADLSSGLPKVEGMEVGWRIVEVGISKPFLQLKRYGTVLKRVRFPNKKATYQVSANGSNTCAPLTIKVEPNALEALELKVKDANNNVTWTAAPTQVLVGTENMLRARILFADDTTYYNEIRFKIIGINAENKQTELYGTNIRSNKLNVGERLNPRVLYCKFDQPGKYIVEASTSKGEKKEITIEACANRLVGIKLAKSNSAIVDSWTPIEGPVHYIRPMERLKAWGEMLFKDNKKYTMDWELHDEKGRKLEALGKDMVTKYDANLEQETQDTNIHFVTRYKNPGTYQIWAVLSIYQQSFPFLKVKKRTIPIGEGKKEGKKEDKAIISFTITENYPINVQTSLGACTNLLLGEQISFSVEKWLMDPNNADLSALRLIVFKGNDKKDKKGKNWEKYTPMGSNTCIYFKEYGEYAVKIYSALEMKSLGKQEPPEPSGASPAGHILLKVCKAIITNARWTWSTGAAGTTSNTETKATTVGFEQKVYLRFDTGGLVGKHINVKIWQEPSKSYGLRTPILIDTLSLEVKAKPAEQGKTQSTDGLVELEYIFKKKPMFPHGVAPTTNYTFVHFFTVEQVENLAVYHDGSGTPLKPAFEHENRSQYKVPGTTTINVCANQRVWNLAFKDSGDKPIERPVPYSTEVQLQAYTHNLVDGNNMVMELYRRADNPKDDKLEGSWQVVTAQAKAKEPKPVETKTAIPEPIPEVEGEDDIESDEIEEVEAIEPAPVDPPPATTVVIDDDGIASVELAPLMAYLQTQHQGPGGVANTFYAKMSTSSKLPLKGTPLYNTRASCPSSQLRLVKEAVETQASDKCDDLVIVEYVDPSVRKGKCKRCGELTVDDFRKMFVDVEMKTVEEKAYYAKPTTIFSEGEGPLKNTSIEEFVAALNVQFKQYGINNCNRKVMFLAFCYSETNFKYTVETITLEAANAKYQNIKGLGNKEKNDGYKFRGRGLIQCTGRHCYQTFQDFLQSEGETVDLIANPDLISTRLDLMIKSAIWFLFKYKGIAFNAYADRCNITSVHMAVAGLTTTAMEMRIKRYLFTMKNYGLSDCVFFSSPSNTISMHIYHDGRIERHVPKGYMEKEKKFSNNLQKLSEAEIFNYNYYYHHKNGNEYELGQFFAVKAYNWGTGKRLGDREIDKSYDKLAEIGEGDSLIQYSDVYKYDLYYKRLNPDTNVLIQVPSEITANGLNFKCIDGEGTSRHYANPFAFAALLGAMINCGFTDFGYRGFTNITGTGSPSKNHNNGYYLDMGFLRKQGGVGRMHLTNTTDKSEGIANFDDVRQWNFFKELHRFKFTRHLVYTNGTDRNKVDKSETTGESLGEFVWDDGHYNHLHTECQQLRDIDKNKMTIEVE